MKISERFKSWAVWTSLVPVILILGDTYGLWNVINMPKTTFIQLLTSLGSALVTFGILNNPTDKENF
jgi:uncharacterized membrane protein